MLSSDELRLRLIMRLSDNPWTPSAIELYRSLLQGALKTHPVVLQALDDLPLLAEGLLLRFTSLQHGLSRQLPSVNALYIFPVVFGLLLSAFWFTRRFARVPGSQELYDPLNALMSIVVPTASRWPAEYLQIAREGVRARRTTLLIPIRLVHDDFIRGELELTQSTSDLPDLVADTLQNGIWRLHLCADPLYFARVTAWIFLSYLACLVPRFYSISTLSNQKLGAFEEAPDDKPRQGTAVGISSSSGRLEPSRNVTTDGRATLTLDDIPHASVRTCIRVFQASLSADASVLIGFTTLDPTVKIFSATFVKAALPFLPRMYAKRLSSSLDNKQSFPSTRRTSVSLLTSLDNVLKALTTGPTPLIVESVQNVSDQYANHLESLVHDLTESSDSRSRFIKCWNVEGWREERFLCTWEEALCRAGILTRWVVLARK